MTKRAEYEKAWKKYLDATDPKELEKRAKFYYTRAHRRIGIAFVRIARDFIKQKRYTANAPLTVAMKGKSLPLSDTGELIGSLTYQVRGSTSVVVGVARSPMAGTRLLYEVLHDGARIRVTPKMIYAVMMKVKKRLNSGNFKGASTDDRRQHQSALETTMEKLQAVSGKIKGASFWIIPPRPFLLAPLQSKEFVGIVVAEWTEAMYLTILKPVEEHKADMAARRAAAKAKRTKRPRPNAKPKRSP